MPPAGLTGSSPRLHAVPDLPAPPDVPPVLVVARVPDVVRAGLEVLLRPYADRVGLVLDGDRALAHVEMFDPSVETGDQVATTPRVALMWDTSTPAVERARALGAVRVLSLSLGVEELVAACEQAHRSGSTPSSPRPEVAPNLADLLSPREVDVIRGICRGLSNADIAEELFISLNSVKTYIRTAYRKMAVSSRSQALLWGLEHHV